ncbi:formylglycine-generating enzyme family protein [Thiothrix winogradskyi]|uniref:Formylglycine-generating enzyme family protein n=1 Tax=Thiothrix winogradskyi TaxID=96472 RepID=A0ABY3SZ48_9GAMM|nr:formylglycine-generating enzyme family protein [Thiothrix winogradskyi]UJS23730.1 formylglycine-generating enzyme family protein [Thiothrix winogradskyi]
MGDDLLLGTTKGGWIVPQETHDDEIVWVKWQQETRLAREIPPNPPFAKGGTADGVELWLAGENGKPERPTVAGWPVLSVAVIGYPATDADARRLAAKLLDNGTADQVLLGEDWRKHQAEMMQGWGKLPGVQWLYVMPNDHQPPKYGDHIARFAMSPEELLEKLAKPGVLDPNSLQAKAKIKGEPRLMGFAAAMKSLELPQGMKLMPVLQGSFQMGSATGADDEKPVHTVNIGYDFWMSATEVTFAQYDAYVAAVKGKEKPDDQGWGRDTRPVINVSWDDAQGYVKWLSESNGQGLSCRLPTEAEWEYAARAGTTTDYFWGDDIGKNNANCDGCGSEWDNKQTAPVVSFKPNQWGLQDMHGNVWEWTQDCWHDNYADAPADGTAWESNADCGRRVVRGGSWNLSPNLLRSSYRYDNARDYRYDVLGFRVVCGLPLPVR